MADLYSDAFAEDRQHQIFGRDVIEEASQFSFSDLGELAVSKSNNVSFLKIDDLDADLRNILVVGESFICYSVTAKRTSIRAIDTVSGEKALLKGHDSSILDLKISTTDNDVFCSVDNGSDRSKPHTIIWRRATDKPFNFKTELKSVLPAKIIQPFPVSNAWGISDEHHIGIISTTDQAVTAYTQLPFHLAFEDEITTGFAFAPNGDSLAAIMRTTRGQQYIQVWRIYAEVGDSGLGIGNRGRLVKVYEHFHNQLRLSNVLAISFINSRVITLSKNEDMGLGSRDEISTLPYTLQLWSVNSSAEVLNATNTPRCVQSLTLHLPEYHFRLKSTSLLNPTIECDLRVEPRNGRYLILSSRKSNVVACLALSPANSTTLPIYHVAYLDFKAPVVSMDAATILGREHHSSEEGEHIEVAAYQEEAADQSSIQQYHVLAKSLFDFSKYSGPDSSNNGINSSSSGNSNAGNTILSFLSRVPSAASGNVAPISPSRSTSNSLLVNNPASGGSNANGTESMLLKTLSASNMLNNNNSTVAATLDLTPSSIHIDKATLDNLHSRSVNTNNSGKNGVGISLSSASTGSELGQHQLFPSSNPPTPSNASSATSDSNNDLPDFLRSTVPKHNTPILNAFGRSASGKNTPFTPASTPAPVAATSTVSTPASAPSYSSVLTPKAPPSTATNTPAAPTPVASSTEELAKAQQLITHLKVSGSTSGSKIVSSATPSTATPATPNAPVANGVPVASKSSALLSVLNKSIPTGATVQTPTVLATSNSGTISSTVIAKGSTVLATSSAPPASTAGTSTVTGTTLQVPGSLAEVTSNTAQAQLLAAAADAKTQGGSVNIPASLYHELLQKSLSSAPSSVATATPVAGSSVSKSDLEALRRDLVGDFQAQQQATLSAVQQLLRTNQEASQRSLADTLQQNKQEVVAAVVDTLQTKVLSTLQTKLKESVKDSAKEAIKVHLQDSFRTAFESSLLPAFQTGIDRLFEQINSSVDQGLQNVLEVVAEEQQQRSEQLTELYQQHLATQQQQTGSSAASVIGPETIGSIMRYLATVSEQTTRTENTVALLAGAMAQWQQQATSTAAASANAAGTAAAPEPKKETPLELLARGLVSEAVCAALDNKDVAQIVEVLDQLTPTIVALKCSHLIRLCIAQQLAADMSVNFPQEGMAKRLDWIKRLVLDTVQLPREQLEANAGLKRNYTAMVGAVLESIQAAKVWIQQAQYDNGEDEDDANGKRDIPSSVHMDLQLLEMVMVQTVNRG